MHWVNSRSNCCLKEVMKWIFNKSLLFALKTRGVIFGLRDNSDKHKAILQLKKTKKKTPNFGKKK